MIKTLKKHGNSAALVIERPILDLLGATVTTSFEVVTDGQSLILTPIKDTECASKLSQSINKVGKRYAKTFEELAK